MITKPPSAIIELQMVWFEAITGDFSHVICQLRGVTFSQKSHVSGQFDGVFQFRGKSTPPSPCFFGKFFLFRSGEVPSN